MKERNIERNIEENSNYSLIKVGLGLKLRLKLRQLRRELKEDLTNFIHCDKKQLITDICSSRHFIIWLFIVILLKTILFSKDTVFYNEKIWLWYIRQTAFFIIVIISPLFLFRNSKLRFALGMILNFLISLLLFADELYFSYASNIISVMQTRKLAI